MDQNSVFSREFLYHYLLNPSVELVNSILTNGLRPLSDFPESSRWIEIQDALPGFFEWVYEMMAKPIIQKPYSNSGIFLSPIDFRKMPDSMLFTKERFCIPISAVDPEWSCLSYELEDERIRLPLTLETLEQSSQIWTKPMVDRWFGVDPHRLFYYVPQVVTYQPGGIPVTRKYYQPALDQDNFSD